jgi:hypothetical protein
VAKGGDTQERTSSFWTTLPGVLTGVAALITAITGLTLGLYQYGVLGGKQGDTERPTAASATSPRTTSAGSSEEARASNASAVSELNSERTQRATVAITGSDGNTTTVLLDSFRQTAQYDEQLHLRGGQTIAFENIKSIAVVRTYTGYAETRITLVDDRVIDASLDAGSSIYGFGGENELGTFSINVGDLQRVVFRH